MKITLIILYLVYVFGVSIYYKPLGDETILLSAIFVFIGCVLIDIKKLLKDANGKTD